MSIPVVWICVQVDLRELAKAAEALHEVESTVLDTAPPAAAGGGEVSLAGVEVVAREAAFVRATGEAVRALAGAKLREGMGALNQADVGGALQVGPGRMGRGGGGVGEGLSFHRARLREGACVPRWGRARACPGGGGRMRAQVGEGTCHLTPPHTTLPPQVFFNLGALAERTNLALGSVASRVTDRVGAALDPRALRYPSGHHSGVPP